MGLRIFFWNDPIFHSDIWTLLNKILEELETISLLTACLSGMKNKKHRVLVIFLKPSRLQGCWRPSVSSALNTLLSSFCFPSQRCLTWLTSHLKLSLGSPPFTALATPLQFPWLVPPLWLDLFMLKYLRAQVWAVFSFLIYLISGGAHPSLQSQVLCIRWWFPIFCL